MLSDSVKAVGNNAIEGVIERLSRDPSNNLPEEFYREKVEAGWDGQWLNWDDLGGGDPGWGDIGD